MATIVMTDLKSFTTRVLYQVTIDQLAIYLGSNNALYVIHSNLTSTTLSATTIPSNGGATLSRLWFDNETTTEISFMPADAAGNTSVTINNGTLELPAGTYNFTATFDYPQLTQLSASEVLNEALHICPHVAITMRTSRNSKEADLKIRFLSS